MYFWEFGPDRALRFAHEQQRRGKVKTPAVVGAVLQIGHCFDLLDTQFTHALSEGYTVWSEQLRVRGVPLPTNAGEPPDLLLRRLDCAVADPAGLAGWNEVGLWPDIGSQRLVGGRFGQGMDLRACTAALALRKVLG